MNRGAATRGWLLLLVTLTLTSQEVRGEQQCTWYGKCGPDPAFGDTKHDLNCVYDGPPKPLTSRDDLRLLSEVCPHLTRSSSEVNFCCNGEQIRELASSLATPAAMLGRCPACLENFRRNFCDLTCSPGIGFK